MGIIDKVTEGAEDLKSKIEGQMNDKNGKGKKSRKNRK